MSWYDFNFHIFSLKKEADERKSAVKGNGNN